MEMVAQPECGRTLGMLASKCFFSQNYTLMCATRTSLPHKPKLSLTPWTCLWCHYRWKHTSSSIIYRRRSIINNSLRDMTNGSMLRSPKTTLRAKCTLIWWVPQTLTRYSCLCGTLNVKQSKKILLVAPARNVKHKINAKEKTHGAWIMHMRELDTSKRWNHNPLFLRCDFTKKVLEYDWYLPSKYLQHSVSRPADIATTT